VARIVNRQRGVIMNADLSELNRLRELEDEIAREKGMSAETLRPMVAKVEEYSESHRAMGLPDDPLNILKDDFDRVGPSGARPGHDGAWPQAAYHPAPP
jgi:hypothetical protein